MLTRRKFVRSYYDLVMNPETNPLKDLRPQQKFQLMVYLSMMWTAVFCLSFGAWSYYGELVVGHILCALGIVVTAMVFTRARGDGGRQRVRTYRDATRFDRTPRYDDVWGA